MAISSSNKATGPWQGRVSLFSGRPDPLWEMTQPDAEELLRIWDSLPPSHLQPPAPPPLGYRGCSLRNPSGAEWWAFDGYVTLRDEGGSETREDRDSLFESRLLAGAPPEAREIVAFTEK